MKKYRVLIGVVALAVISIVLQRVPHSPDFTAADKLAQQLNAELDAQNPTFCCYQPGQIANVGVGSSSTGSTAGPGSIILSAAASTARHYLVSANCVNETAGNTVAAIFDSGTIAGGQTVVVKRYIACPPSGAAGEVTFPSPIQFRLGSAVGMAASITASTGTGNSYLFGASSFTAR